jgi:hypothetical protein
MVARCAWRRFTAGALVWRLLIRPRMQGGNADCRQLIGADSSFLLAVGAGGREASGGRDDADSLRFDAFAAQHWLRGLGDASGQATQC